MPVVLCAAPAAIEIEVSTDLLSATLTVNPVKTPMGVDDLVAALTARGLSLADDLPQRLADHLNNTGQVALPEPLQIARGVASVADEPARMDLLVQDSDDNQAGGGFYQSRQYACAAVDQVIARFIPRKIGCDGVSVYGKPLPRSASPDLHPKLGANVRLSADETSIIATKGGRVQCRDMTIRVDPVLEIKANVDFSTGNITFAGDVSIGKNVLDLFTVQAEGTVKVGGSIEAAHVSAGGDLIVNGAILGKEKGACRAGGDIACRHATGAALEAGGDLICHSELADCRVRVGGRVMVEKGVILSGNVIAVGGIIAAVIGSATQTKTILEVGIDATLREQSQTITPKLEQQRQKVIQVRQTIAPLLHNQKKLTAAQKERATELLFEADEMEGEIERGLAPLRERYQAYSTRCKAQVETTQTLHAGVAIRFPHCQTIVPQTITGEAKIVERQTPQGWIAMLVRPSGPAVPLPSKPVGDGGLESLVRLIQKSDVPS